MPEPASEQETAKPTADEDTPLIRACPYVIAAVLAGSLIAMAWVMPAFGAMFRELGYEEWYPLPISVRALVNAPMAAWIASGLLAGSVLSLAAKLLPPKRTERVFLIATILFGVFATFIVFSMFRPLVGLSSHPTAWPSWLPY